MKQKEFLVIGHKGAGDHAPENTIKAILKAIDLKADYVEFDIHKTKDNEIILMHDADTYKTTGFQGIIKEMTLKEIKKLNAGEGEEIPTLKEVIAVAKHKINLQIEIKAEGLIKQLVSILNQENLIESSIISSFAFNELVKLKNEEPKCKIAYLLPAEMKSMRFLKRNILKIVENQFYAVHPHFDITNKEFIEFSHSKNLKVNVWTVNNEQIMQNLIKLGVDGIITDEIELLKSTLKRFYQ